MSTGLNLGYTRVSSRDQHTESHRWSLEQRYHLDRWYEDGATSGAKKALDRLGFGELFRYARDGDTVIVPAVDRLGRNTVDLLTTVEALKAKGVTVVSVREGFDMGTPIGKAMLAMLAAAAELERDNIRERQRVGLDRAKAMGRKLGRPVAADPKAIVAWRRAHQATIRETAEHFGVGASSVKRACHAARVEEGRSV